MRVRKILFSQPPPADIEKSPYASFVKKYNVKIDFFKFFRVEGIPIKRQKSKINLSKYTGLIFTSKNTIDYFFSMLKEMKIELDIKDFKFYCINESIALYLQKYIIYRKRRIIDAGGHAKDLADILKENPDEKYLIPCSLGLEVNPLISLLDEMDINYEKIAVFQIAMADLSHIPINEYDMIVFFSPHGIQSLKENFPDYKQGKTIIGAMGYQVLEAAELANLQVEVMAPIQGHASIFTAIDQFLQKPREKRK